MKKLRPLNNIIETTYKKVEEQETRILVDDQEMLVARVVSDIIGYLVNDVVSHSKNQLDTFDDTKEFYVLNHRFDKRLIYFSEEGEVVCQLLHKLISKRAVNCLEVTTFDRNASQIIKYLFKAYYDNPRLIHKGTLRRMYIDMLYHTGDVIDFIKGDLELVKEEFQKITTYVYPGNKDEWTDTEHMYYQKRTILIRHIVDFIAGMTDSYALNEYKKLTLQS